MSEITLRKWVAGFNINQRFITGEVNVRETAHRYIVIDKDSINYARMAYSLMYVTSLRKDQLFDTEAQAVIACLEVWDGYAHVAKLDLDRAVKKIRDMQAHLDGLASDAS